MAPQVPAGWGDASPEAIEKDVRRVADRLRSLSDVRLAIDTGTGSLADAGRDLAQHLADAAIGIEEQAAAQAPQRRRLPRLGDLAVGDQVAVTGHDLVAALAGVRPDDLVWSREQRLAVAALADQVRGRLAELRRRL